LINRTPLHCAVQSGNSETVALPTDEGASVNARSTDDETALQKAAQRGNAEIHPLSKLLHHPQGGKLQS
jgi:ankyrin repeat protein